MSQKLKTHTCPECKTRGNLIIESKLVLKPIGVGHSLSGSQIKTSGSYKPVIVCTTPGCSFSHPGEYAELGYATFEPFGE